ncbi:MAG TPA: hypothetical protein VF145_12820 [Chitinophagaceae bacterium]
MNEQSLISTGKWMADLTLVTGGALDTYYLVTKELEAGTLAYFFLVFAGIVNSVVLLPMLVPGVVSKANGRRLLLVALLMLACYILLAIATWYMFRL